MTPEELGSCARADRGDRRRRGPTRRSRRLRAAPPRARRSTCAALARASLATGGDPLERRFRRRVDAPRKLVVLCDVSGSMEAYARALLLFLHAVVRVGPRRRGRSRSARG